jgi:hypothetical protein
VTVRGIASPGCASPSRSALRRPPEVRLCVAPAIIERSGTGTPACFVPVRNRRQGRNQPSALLFGFPFNARFFPRSPSWPWSSQGRPFHLMEVVMIQKQFAAKHSDCKICQNAEGSETFRYMSKKYIFDIDKAQEFIADGREAVELEDEDVRFSLKKCRISKKHTRHVDTSIPGIVAIVFATTKEGKQVSGHRLIDGHHRAARCLDLGIPYRVYVLNEQESIEILKKSPFKPVLEPASV